MAAGEFGVELVQKQICSPESRQEGLHPQHHSLDAMGFFPSGNQTPSLLIRDLSGQRRGPGEEVEMAALNNGFLMD